VPVLEKNARLVGRLGSGPCLVADTANVVFTHTCTFSVSDFQSIIFEALERLGKNSKTFNDQLHNAADNQQLTMHRRKDTRS